ncbi:MAG: hypothetical protein NTY02_17140 [Acidobacteria bacterium]|nr:hypothetical protein [Acidobacteriota bacterium]
MKQAQAWAQQYGGRTLTPAELANLTTLYTQRGGGQTGMDAVLKNIQDYAQQNGSKTGGGVIGDWGGANMPKNPIADDVINPGGGDTVKPPPTPNDQIDMGGNGTRPDTPGSTAASALTATYAPPPAYTAPTLTLPESLSTPTPYVAPQLTAPTPYTALTAEELARDPSYQWRFDQGRKAVEGGQAAKGITRTGGALVDLTNYGQNAASQEYAAADARKRADYGLNWDVATGAFDRNTAASADARDFNWNATTGVYDRNVDAAKSQYDAAFQGSQAEYAPNLLGWQTKTANDQRNAELAFDRDWQKEIYNRDDAWRQKTYNTDDAYRKMVYMNDDAFRKAVYTTDDAFRKAVQAETDVWKREVMAEERRRWLAELGAQ